MSFPSLAQNPLPESQRPASFATLDQRAKNGEALSVVFFGGSLTWGANASNPNLTSYRGRMMQYLRDRYPTARWQFHDAAIGGTGSNLAMFRLERDVLAKKPDLVFLDFMANDTYDERDNETRSCYETLLRKMIAQGIAIQQMYFGFKIQFTDSGYDLEKFTRRTDYMTLAEAYQLAEGDLYPLVHNHVKNGDTTLDLVWDIDGAHPGDEGYAYFFEAARQGFEAAIAEDLQNRLPTEPVFGVMTHLQRIRLTDLTLPAGWAPSKTYRTSMWFDGLSSRWMDNVACYQAKDAETPQALTVEFEGDLIGFFGEANHHGLDFTLVIDEEPFPFIHNDKSSDQWPFSIKYGEGNLFVWKSQKPTGSTTKHRLEILPVITDANAKAELRIESLCAAIYQPAPAYATQENDQ